MLKQLFGNLLINVRQGFHPAKWIPAYNTLGRLAFLSGINGINRMALMIRFLALQFCKRKHNELWKESQPTKVLKVKLHAMYA